MPTGGKVLSTGMFTFIVLWVLAGLAALAMSVWCAAKHPATNTESDILGVILAVFLGPFYWLYYFYKGGYCGRA